MPERAKRGSSSSEAGRETPEITMAEQTGTSVPAEQHNFPPFDKQTFPSQLLWLTLVFVALYLLMSRIALPRIDSIMAARRGRIDGGGDRRVAAGDFAGRFARLCGAGLGRNAGRVARRAASR